MKFLLFNMVVVLALGYLILTKSGRGLGTVDEIPSLSTAIEKISAAVGEAQSSFERKEKKLLADTNREISNSGSNSQSDLDVHEKKLDEIDSEKSEAQNSAREIFSLLNETKEVAASQDELSTPKMEPRESETKRAEIEKVLQPVGSDSSKPIEVSARRIHKTPQFDKRSAKAERLGKDSLAQTNESDLPKAQSKFMTPKERRRELNRLAREMELFFVEKLNM